MRGGIKVYQGSPVAALNYLATDRCRADDYYLGEGAGVAQQLVVTSSHVAGDQPYPATAVVGNPVYGVGGHGISVGGTLAGDAYQAWVAGYDGAGCAKGRLGHA